MAERINRKYELLLIGGSAGSLEVVLELLPALRPSLGLAVVLVLHRKPGESLLPGLLSSRLSWPVKEAEEKDPILPNSVYIAPADYHLLIEKDRSFSLDYSEKVHYSRPSIEVSFETAAEAYGPSMAALLLSGANADGASGLLRIQQAGGLTLVQEPAEASVSYMPQQALQIMKPDHVARTSELSHIINNWNRIANP